MNHHSRISNRIINTITGLLISASIVLLFFRTDAGRPLGVQFFGIFGQNQSIMPTWLVDWTLRGSKFAALYAGLAAVCFFIFKPLIAYESLSVRLVLRRIVVIFYKSLLSVTVFLLLWFKTYYVTLFTATEAQVSLIVPSTLLIMILIIPSLSLRRKRLPYLLIINLVVSVLLFIDLSYFRGFSELPTTAVLSGLDNFQEGADGGFSPWVLVRKTDFMLFLDFIPLLVLGRLYRQHQVFSIGQSVVASLIGWCFFFALHFNFNYMQNFAPQNEQFNTRSWIADKGVLAALFYNELEIAAKNRGSLSSTEEQEMMEWYQKNRKLNPPTPYDGLFKGKNLLFILNESLESTFIGASLNGQELTPEINKILRNSLYFPNIYEQTTANTVHAQLITLTGLYSPYYGIVSQNLPDNDYSESSGAYFFKKAGYETFYASSDTGKTWRSDLLAKHMGYDTVLHVNDGLIYPDDPFKTSSYGLSDEELYKESLQRLKGGHKPFMAFLLTTSGHMPFDYDMNGQMPTPFKTDNPLLTNYFNTLHFVDYSLGQLIRDLEKQGLLNNTVVVITGDHMGLSKYYKGSYPELEHLEYYQQGQELGRELKVPLIIYNHGLNGQLIERVGGQVDILPTILSLMGFNNKDFGRIMPGYNLMNPEHDFALLPQGEIVGRTEGLDKEFIAKGRFYSNVLLQFNLMNKITDRQ